MDSEATFRRDAQWVEAFNAHGKDPAWFPVAVIQARTAEFDRIRALANEWREKCKESLDVASAMGQRGIAMERERDAALVDAAHLRAAMVEVEAQRDQAEARAAIMGDELDRLHDFIGTRLIDGAPKPAPSPVHNPFRSFARDPRRMGNT